MKHTPEILAPAGDMNSFFAAVSAGADAVYLGLKNFSARMQAANFSIKELARMRALADDKGVKLYVALNNLLKPSDLDAAGRLIDKLERSVKPAALILQDLGALELARQTDFSGELHLSTLGNISHPAGLPTCAEMGAHRVVVPRELDIDEIQLMADACPPELSLEVFIHGALCFCVSGRCYWSSYMGGKSGLRGRCVQPCRRLYTQGPRKGRFFSCQDLSLDILAKTLLNVPKVSAWKIEGRKKGPHYVFYTVTAYRMLRDTPNDPEIKKEIQSMLSLALGRKGSHYNFLPQRKHSPVGAGSQKESDTGSGLLAGKIAKSEEKRVFFKPRFPLLNGDLLRIGFEDEPWHRTIKVRRSVPKGGRMDLPAPQEKRAKPKAGVHVFLVDRREPELMKRIQALGKELEAIPDPKGVGTASKFTPKLQAEKKKTAAGKSTRIIVMRNLQPGKKGQRDGQMGIWLSRQSMDTVSKTLYGRTWWWLPPVVWPGEEKGLAGMLQRLMRKGAKQFVLNAPWQMPLFEKKDGLQLVAGPFCNVGNGLAVESLARLGFTAAIVSPELSGEDFLSLPAQSPLPLGIVLKGSWPMGVSRIVPEAVKHNELLTSPKGEGFITRRYGANLWIYPAWQLDISEHKQALEKAGYSLFIHLYDTFSPKNVNTERTSMFNWEHGVL